MDDNEKEKEIGALWLRTSKQGNKFYTGKISVDGKDYNIVVFKNKNKKGQQPDLKIFPSILNNER